MDRMYFQFLCGHCNEVENLVELKKNDVLHKSVIAEHICKRTGLTYLIEVSRGFHLKQSPKDPKDDDPDDALDPKNKPNRKPPDDRDFG